MREENALTKKVEGIKLFRVKTKPGLLIMCALGMGALGFFGCQTTTGGKLPETGGNRDFIVSEEQYDKTFSEIVHYLKRIDDIIKRSDFEDWKTNLTPAFIAHYSDPAVLKDLSTSPNLKSLHIELKTIRDYFIWVFAPSRQDGLSVQTDQIKFINAKRVRAETVVDGKTYVLLLLEKDGNNEWKIGVW